MGQYMPEIMGEITYAHALGLNLYGLYQNQEAIRKYKKVIIVEGIMLFAIPEIVNLLDIKIFVDTDADVRILRRILRDVKERGRSLDSVVDQYVTTVKPMHESYIEPFKRYSDVIVPEGGYNQNAFDMIVSTIVDKIKK